MDQARWNYLLLVLRKATRQLARHCSPQRRRPRFSDLLIAKLYFFAVASDRPVSWAAQRQNLDRRRLRPRTLPSVSQLNRRVASARFQQLLQLVHQRLTADAMLDVLCIDGHALVVSPVSGDRDARSGYHGGAMAKGFKLHAVVSQDGKIPRICTLPLNCNEMPVARQMLLSDDLLAPGTRVLADANYDAHVLHKHVHARGGRLICQLRGRARHPVTLKQMGPARRRLLQLWDRHPAAMETIYRHRLRIERVFGNLVATPGLLGPLPSFVRGLTRVQRWVSAKISLYHVHCDVRRGKKTPP